MSRVYPNGLTINEAEHQRRKDKRVFLNAYKAMLGCKDCGRHDGRLDFDHRDPASKRFKVNASCCYSWAKLLAEVAKCDVRCASCHTKRHHREDPAKRLAFIEMTRRRAAAREKASATVKGLARLYDNRRQTHRDWQRA